MGNRLKKLKKIKKIRLHHEGTRTLVFGAILFLGISIFLHLFIQSQIPFYLFSGVSICVYLILVNFFQCPIRCFEGDTEGLVIAPADGKVVVVEEVEETEYFHDRRMMVSIFMSLFNVHANWIPVDGTIKMVKHYDGNFHKAWLPKASEENERADTMIETPEGYSVLVRQIAGAVARRIVTYAKDLEECYIDEHLGFIKLGSRVDVYLPLGSVPEVKMGQRTTGDLTVIARLPEPQTN